MCGSTNFRQGGGGGSRSVWQKSSDNVFFFFFFGLFSPQLISQKSNCQFQRNLSFFKVQEGVQHFPGGSNFFKGGGGGVQLLIPYRNPYNLWFSRGVRTPCPPSGSVLDNILWDAPDLTRSHHFCQKISGRACPRTLLATVWLHSVTVPPVHTCCVIIFFIKVMRSYITGGKLSNISKTYTTKSWKLPR